MPWHLAHHPHAAYFSSSPAPAGLVSSSHVRARSLLPRSAEFRRAPARFWPDAVALPLAAFFSAALASAPCVSAPCVSAVFTSAACVTAPFALAPCLSAPFCSAALTPVALRSAAFAPPARLPPAPPPRPVSRRSASRRLCFSGPCLPGCRYGRRRAHLRREDLAAQRALDQVDGLGHGGEPGALLAVGGQDGIDSVRRQYPARSVLAVRYPCRAPSTHAFAWYLAIVARATGYRRSTPCSR